MFLSSCAPSPMVRVVSPDAKKVAQQNLKSSQMNSEKNKQNDNSKINSSNTQNKKTYEGNPTVSADGTPGGGGTIGQSGAAAAGSASTDKGSGSNQPGNSGTGNKSNDNQPKGTGNNPSPNGGNGSGNGAGKFSPGGTQTVDIDGEQKEIPKDIKSVAAAGIYADITEMLGGTLVATSQDNLSNTLFTSVFKNSSSAKPYMPLSGQAMTTSQAKSLAELPADERPQAVVCDSSTFAGDGSAAQEILSDAQIKFLYVEENSASDVSNENFNTDPYKVVLHNVYYFGEMLKDKCSVSYNGTTIPADKMAKEYNDYYKNNLDLLQGKYPYANEQLNDNSSVETYGKRHFSLYADKFFVSSLLDVTDSAVNYNKYNSNLDNVNSLTSKLVSEGSSGTTYLTLSDIADSNFRYSYMELSGIEKNLFMSALQMVNIKYQGPVSYNNKDPNGALQIGPGMYGDWSTTLNDTDHIIVSSKTTDDGKYTVRLPEYATYNAPRQTWAAFAEEKLDVQPVGIHRWTSTAPESVLEPLWLATVFHNEDSGIDIKTQVKDFYSKFYHCDLNENQINQILKIQ